MANVTFNGSSSLIVVNNGITTIDTKTDLYSQWKEWAVQSDNLKYLPAFRSIGGDPTISGQFAGDIYFIMNGWKIRPYEGNHTLTITGTLFIDGGVGTYIVPTLGTFTVLVTNISSSTVNAVNFLSSQQVSDAVWNATTLAYPTSGTLGKEVAKIQDVDNAQIIYGK